MPPKSKQPSKNAAFAAQPDKIETIAILLADAFETTQLDFGPLIAQDEPSSSRDSTKPFCLLNLAGVPIIAYALDALTNARIDKIYIYAQLSSTEAIRNYIATSFSNSPSQIIIRSTAASSEGDIMREVDALQLKTNFLLVRAGYLGNLDLATVLNNFGEKIKKDPNLCMDCVISKRLVRQTASRSIHVLTPTSRLVHYEVNSTIPRKRRCRIPNEVLEEGHSQLSIQTDLEGVGIEVCSPEVPPLFTENFDYQSLRPHFINGILTSDLLGKTISCSIVGAQLSTGNTDWAMLVDSVRTFASASHAVLARYCFPITPDGHLPGKRERLAPRKNRVYTGMSVDIARTATLISSLLDSSTVVGSHTLVKSSTIGDHCQIGSQCQLINAHLGNRVVIHDSVRLENCLIGDNVQVQSGSVLCDGSIVGPGTTAGPSSRLRAAMLGSSEGYSLVSPVESTLGAQSQGIVWQQDPDQDEDSRQLVQLGSDMSRMRLHSPASSVSSLSRSSSADDLKKEAMVTSEGDEADATEEAEFKSLRKEVNQFLDRAFEEDHTVDNLVIELKTMRMANNVSLSDVREIFTIYMCSHTLVDSQASIKQRYATVQQSVQRWGQALVTLAPMEEQDEIDVLLAVQTWCADAGNAQDFVLWLRALYEDDVTTEEAIFGWWKSPESRSDDNEKLKQVRSSAMTFVQRLAEADSDDESD